MVSVVVPVYNVEKYLDICIKSLLSQTYQDFEIILINDGSTDGSGALCEEWAKKDSRIRVFHQENKGLAAVRNRGVELADGEYIAWVDSDDYVDNCYLEKLLTTWQNTNADMVICSFYTDTDGEVVHAGKNLFRAEEIDRKTFLERFYTEGMYSILCNKLLPTAAYRGICFPSGRWFEDSSVMYHLSEGCEKIVIIDEPLYYYRRHKESITLQKRDEKKSLRYINDIYLWLKEDVELNRAKKNEKLVALASRRLCDEIIRYSGELSKENQRKWKQIFNQYKKDILRCKSFSLKTKMKYAVGGVNLSLCRYLMRFVKR